MKDALERAALILSAAAAITVAGILAKREFLPPSPKDLSEPTKVSNWEAFDHGGQVIGDGPTTLIVFSDYQCPACGMLEKSIQQVMKEGPHRIRVRYRHYPLEQSHQYARALALGAECAAAIGRFAAFHREVFAAQDSLAHLSVISFLERSGIEDTASFRSCLSSAKADARVEADKGAGDTLGLRATPTFLLGGKRYVGAVSPQRLDSLLSKLEAH